MALPDPILSWAVRRDSTESYQENDDFFAGTYTKKNGISFELLLWNNRYGTVTVQDLQNFSIEFSYDDVEDSALVNYTTFVLDDYSTLTPILNGTTGVLHMPESVILSGAPNDGTEDSTLNYVKLKMQISIPEGKRVKMNDIKAMTFSVVRL